MPTRVGDVLGRAGGLVLAPLTATISAVRRARMFHPRGIALRADVRPRARLEPWDTIAERLRGPALVRLSSAWWKHGELKDVLGVAIRFTRGDRMSARPGPGDQDLLFATIRRPWTMPIAPLTTRAHDFFANDYFAVSPFEVHEAGAVEWRLVPDGPIEDGHTREEKLAIAIARGHARFVLEGRPYRRLIDVGRHRDWHPVADVVLLERVVIDDDALRFDPYRAGRGIRPAGFVHSLRRAAYAASQWARARAMGIEPHEEARVVDLEKERARRHHDGHRHARA
ncbi:hypothetical protein [Sandaracinus amylolyticus]|uniref:hypothetical protein n=1 Tax=Sandaracinus amylolyticus TaxID=927083 RepID=UPI001F4488F4|nr:hypothetical protein [Sandaracinus amylolyticus]UJR85723.1 Hypothetical protein I5071_78030 [Sandaracinus amylolyticus]